MGRPPRSRNKTETGTDIVTIDQPTKSVLIDMSNRYGMEPAAFEATVRATCMKPDKDGRVPTREEFAAFLLVAKEYNLNPLTKEIYAYSSRGGGIVPIVSVDGWVNLVNSQGQCDGFDFTMDQEGERLISCTCTMYRKDRKHPVVVTEYFSECYRPTDPWKMKHRMLRHKSFIQAARYAFGFSGIYDEDEGQKIAEIDPNKDAAPPRTITVEASKQIEPPRSTAPEPGPGEEHAAGEVRDGAPPRRTAAPPKEDPITTGPQQRRETVTEEVKPHRIPGTGLNAEQWVEKYLDLIQTSPDMATVYAWIDANSKSYRVAGVGEPQAGPLTRIAKMTGKAVLAKKISDETKRIIEKMRDAKEKAGAKTAAKTKPADPPPSEMGDESAGDMDDAPDTPTDPEAILAAIDRELAAVENPDDLQGVWETACDPLVEKLEFPPDKDQAQAIFDKHSRRLGGD